MKINMTTLNSLIRFLAIPAISLSLVSCNKELSTGSDFLIMVDSINVPGVVDAETPFDIVFFGTIGFNGCVSFKTFNMEIYDDQYTIGAWATYDQNNKTCPDVLVSLNGKKLSLIIPTAGTYYILITEPNGYVITKQITVN